MSPDGLPPDPLSYRGLDPAALDRTGLGRPVWDPTGERPVGERPEGAAAVSKSAVPLLDVRDLRVSFATREGEVRAVDGVSFALGRGEVLAIVGESGSGKSVCAMTLMGLTRGPNTTISGQVRLEGRELIGASEAQLRRIRGAELAMVFQDPQSSLNPVYRVGDQIAEQIRTHEPFVPKARALERAAELMERARIPKARERVRAYPHELSGGMRQRVMIAMGLSLGAKVLLADEPTTALDVTVQAQILAQLKDLRDQEDLSILLITHDFGVVADIADRIAVMRAGEIVEQGVASEIFERPQHPYTRGLLDALRASTPKIVPRPAEGVLARAAAGSAEEDLVSFAEGRPARARGAETRTSSLNKTPRARGGSILEVENLRVSYPGRGRHEWPIEALAGVSLTLGESETLAIVGESGCGKTTLLRSIAGLIAPSAGTIRLGGQDLSSRQPPRAGRRPRRAGHGLPRSPGLPEPAPASRSHLGARPARARTRQAASAIGDRRPARAGGLASRAGRSASPTNFPAGSASAWGSRARSRANRAWSCSTSRSPPWTLRSAAGCSTCWSACKQNSVAPTSSYPTTSPPSKPWPTGSP